MKNVFGWLECVFIYILYLHINKHPTYVAYGRTAVWFDKKWYLKVNICLVVSSWTLSDAAEECAKALSNFTEFVRNLNLYDSPA